MSTSTLLHVTTQAAFAGQTCAWAQRASLALRKLSVMGVTALVTSGALASTPLADQPVFSTTSVPGNLALALSVEFPTAVSVAHTDGNFRPGDPYLGYFDPDKCYLYQHSATASARHFYPSGAAVARLCTGTQDAKWSGNFLNWATMQTIDPFRWVLTGGYRSTDTDSLTLIEKAWASGQGGTGNFPNRSYTGSPQVTNVTPFNRSQFRMRIQGLGNAMRFSISGSVDNTPTLYTEGMSINDNTTYEVTVRVKVCDPSAGAGALETNCTRYPNGNYKPTGLMQLYAEQIRYSAFGYLNDSNINRDGGVLRAQQKFIGPNVIVPGSTPQSNPAAEWSSSTGVYARNPDATDASATLAEFGVNVSDSGVLNYLNKFGQITPGSYKTYDNVSEMYYAALRYFKKQGNVPEWTSMSGASTATRTTWIDGFPVITNWNDPIQYACQRNFILGIGDVNTHADRNLPGATGTSEPSKPALVAADTTVNSVTATNKVGQLHGIGNIGNTQNYNGCCSNNGALIAGLAYDANTQDIRPDDPADLLRTKGRQSVQTYWLDVLEYQTYKSNNQYYLATKYGGFTVPEGYDAYGRTSDIPQAWWRTNTDTVGTQPRPDTYFIASRPDQVVAGLTQTFANIASRLKAYTTSFATALPQVSASGTASYSTVFDSRSWTGELSAIQTSFDAGTGTPTRTEAWSFSTRLDALASGNGWDTARRIATWNTSSASAVPFRLGSLGAPQQAALDTATRSGNDAQDFLNYLRGDKLHERSSTTGGSAKAYRDRGTLLGDIGGFKARPVSRPDAPYSNSSNPGYSAFKTAWTSRPTVVFVGSNAGMVHAVHGSQSGADAGKELFAYVPGLLFSGPSGTPSIDGLQALASPDYQHRNFVDATPAVADVDFGRTVGGSGTDWRSILVGGLGKGGRGLYALDITDAAGVSNEGQAVGRVLWEFTDADMGFVYGEPAIVKTKKHGWVVIVASGYNNANGQGYLYFINPRTGALLDKVGTGAGSASAQAGMAHVQAFLLDRSDGTADAIYSGDLLGNLWRFDVTVASGALPAPLRLAQLQDASSNPLPVTSRPLLVVHPETNRRYITVGTGRLLHTSDNGSAQSQRFYAIIDGNGSKFARSTGADLPAGMSYPIRSANLRQLTDLTQKVTLDLTSEIGWYVDLGLAAGVGWRVVSDSTSFYGTVAFAAMQPGGSINPCDPVGINRVYAIDLGTGKSRLTGTPNSTSTTPVVSFLSVLPGVVTDLRFLSVTSRTNGSTSGQTIDSTRARLIGGTDTGAAGALNGTWGEAGATRRLNWREVVLND